MKQKYDQYTVDMFEKKWIERPRKSDVKTFAERMAAYRSRNKFNMLMPAPRDEFAEVQ